MKNEVYFEIPGNQLGKSDVKFQVWQDEKKLGTLAISKGTLVWFPKSTQYGYKITWGRFDELVKDSNWFEKRKR